MMILDFAIFHVNANQFHSLSLGLNSIEDNRVKCPSICFFEKLYDSIESENANLIFLEIQSLHQS